MQATISPSSSARPSCRAATLPRGEKGGRIHEDLMQALRIWSGNPADGQEQFLNLFPGKFLFSRKNNHFLPLIEHGVLSRPVAAAWPPKGKRHFSSRTAPLSQELACTHRHRRTASPGTFPPPGHSCAHGRECGRRKQATLPRVSNSFVSSSASEAWNPRSEEPEAQGKRSLKWERALS